MLGEVSKAESDAGSYLEQVSRYSTIAFLVRIHVCYNYCVSL